MPGSEGESKETAVDLKNLFVTEEEQAVMEQFEQEKQKDIEEALGQNMPKLEIRQGWNEWAGQGSGINNEKIRQRAERAEKLRRDKINELRKNRADSKTKGVVLNTEERDKKFAHKYWVKELPHPYSSQEQYQKAMASAVGKEWKTHQSFKRSIQPEVLTKAGEIIKPLKLKTAVSASTMESLVQQR